MLERPYATITSDTLPPTLMGSGGNRPDRLGIADGRLGATNVAEIAIAPTMPAGSETPHLPAQGQALALVIAGFPRSGVPALADRVRAFGGLVVWLRRPIVPIGPGVPLGRRLRPVTAMRPGDLHITSSLAQAFDEMTCDLADRLSLWGLDTVWITGDDLGLAAGPAARQAQYSGFQPTVLVATADHTRPGLMPMRAALAADGIPTPSIDQAQAALADVSEAAAAAVQPATVAPAAAPATVPPSPATAVRTAQPIAIPATGRGRSVPSATAAA